MPNKGDSVLCYNPIPLEVESHAGMTVSVVFITVEAQAEKVVGLGDPIVIGVTIEEIAGHFRWVRPILTK
jgi:hypothetical protein